MPLSILCCNPYLITYPESFCPVDELLVESTKVACSCGVSTNRRRLARHGKMVTEGATPWGYPDPFIRTW